MLGKFPRKFILKYVLSDQENIFDAAWVNVYWKFVVIIKVI